MGLMTKHEEKQFWADAYKTAKPVVMAGAFVAGNAAPAPVAAPAAPAPVATRKAINVPSAAFSEEQLARIESALRTGTLKPASVAAAPVVVSFSQQAVEDGAALHLAKLQAARANLRSDTDASYQASFNELRSAQSAARDFYGDVLAFVEKDQPAEAPELCAALSALDRTCAAIDQTVL